MTNKYMTLGELKISASIDHDGDATFDIVVSRGLLQTHVWFWGIATCFEEFGKKLADFPHNLKDVATLEIGQIRPGFSQHYLLLQAYCYDANGHSALKIVTHNNEIEPQTQRVEFSIPADAAALNRLGDKLRSWQPDVMPELLWQAQIS